MRLQWVPNASVSALHSGEMCAKFASQLTDPTLLERLGGYVASIEQLLQPKLADTRTFWYRLIATAAEIGPNFELAQTALLKCGVFANASVVNTLAGHITDIEASFNQLYPKHDEQVLLRVRPLQEQWLGYGQGVMAHLGRMTDKSLIPEEVRVIPVQPVIGGYGWAHIETNMLRIEAMLTNPMVEIPEIVRLGWLASQVQLELPRFSELLGATQLHKVAPFAMLPPVLAAAQVVELSACTEENVALAIENWHIPVPQGWDLHERLVPTLLDWWETYLTTRPEWHIAMQALGKMLAAD
jgi:hypothetical protein